MTNHNKTIEPDAVRAKPSISGVGRVLVFVYGVLALAATGRSVSQILTHFDDAPLAYVLSLVAGLVYILATVALVARGRMWYRVAVITIVFELVGVLVVGLVSVLVPELFPRDTVWSTFGRGYFFIPLVLPVLGIWWLSKHRPAASHDNAEPHE